MKIKQIFTSSMNVCLCYFKYFNIIFTIIALGSKLDPDEAIAGVREHEATLKMFCRPLAGYHNDETNQDN